VGKYLSYVFAFFIDLFKGIATLNEDLGVVRLIYPSNSGYGVLGAELVDLNVGEALEAS